MDVVGKTNVPPTGPVMLVSNHQSHLDPVLIGVACTRQLRFLARETLFRGPFGWLIRSLGSVPIDRDRSVVSAIKAMLKLLREGEAVLVFPEGSRSWDGQLQPMLGGFLALARRSEATIVPVTIDGAFAAMPRGTLVPRPMPIRLTFGEAISPAEISNRSDDELVALVTSRIAACFTSALECAKS
jgi:1-acyl-sn-glycerol-3-phosphate acyltransferase